MIMKTLTAGILSASLALTAMTPTTASAAMSDEDALAGILTLLFIGAAIHNSRDRNDTPDVVSHPRLPRDWRVLPEQCIRQVTRQNGDRVRLFGQSCLNDSYNYMNRLPQACHVRLRTDHGQRRQGYRVRCMRDAGFRTNRH